MLKRAEDEACRYENAAREAEAEIRDQMSIVKEAQTRIQFHQENVMNWMALSEWYRARCLQCSDSLGHIMAFLQQNPSEIDGIY